MNANERAELERLRAENAELKAKAQAKVKAIVTEKGCVAIVGLRRFPISLYPSEWTTIFAMQKQIEQTISTAPQANA